MNNRHLPEKAEQFIKLTCNEHVHTSVAIVGEVDTYMVGMGSVKDPFASVACSAAVINAGRKKTFTAECNI